MPSSFDGHFAERAAVLAALTKLVEGRNYDGVSITEICAAAHISKSTFYRLFTSKYEVIGWLLNTYSHSGLDQIGRTLTWKQGLSYSVYNLGKHRKFLAAANLTRYADESPRAITYQHRRDTLFETVEVYKGAQLTMRLRCQIESWAKASTDLSAHWYLGELGIGIEEYISCLLSMVPAELFILLNEPANPRQSAFVDGAMSEDATIDLAINMLNSIGLD